MEYKKIYKRFQIENKLTLYNGDCFNLLKKIPDSSIDLVITSPPYCIGKAYEDPDDDIETFKKQHEKIFSEIYRILKVGGSVCWQVGYHIIKSTVIPLDYIIYEVVSDINRNKDIKDKLNLRNRIIWTFGHGLNSEKRFSGRHEVILWFTKGVQRNFDLDSIRVPQKYPGKKAYKGKNKGTYSGHPLGKNPSDVWDIPNVKAQHLEKTDHPCQFPVAIPQRLIKALAPEEGVVFDPFMGSGTTGVAAVLENRRFVGAELKNEYYKIAEDRVRKAVNGEAKIREDRPALKPDPNSSVAKLPDEFAKLRGEL